MTGYFAWQQWQTAVDKLRYDLFEKRYAIYNEVKKLLRTVLNDLGKPDFRPFDVAQHYIVLDEAIFFFSKKTCDWIEDVKADCQALLVEDAGRREGSRNPSKLLGAANETQRPI